VLVVGSGAKSLLDVPATAEVLETLGVPVLGYRTDELPLFYAAAGGRRSARGSRTRKEPPPSRAHTGSSGGAGLLLGNAPENEVDVEELLEQALRTAAAENISGQAVTPFVLSFLHERSGGRTLEVNRELVVANAGLAAQVAIAFSRISPR